MRVRLDLASARLRADDGSHLGWLRGELGPVLPCVHPAGALVLSAGLAREVLGRPARYSSAAMAGADGRLLGADGPAHRRLRQGVVRCVRGTATEPAAERARHLVAAFAAGGGGDAVARVARPLSHAVAAEVTGLPATVVSGLSGWAGAAVAAATGPGGTADTGVGPLSRDATARVRAALAGPAAPPGSVLALLAAAVAAGGLPPDGAVEVLLLVLLAALDTTAALVCACLDALARDPAPAGDPDALVAAVLRRRGPVRFVRRVATEDHHLDGVPVPAGSAVLVHLRAAGAGLRDADSLAFGAGPHACPGARLARQVASAVVRAAAPVRLCPAGPPVPGTSAQIDAYAALPLGVR